MDPLLGRPRFLAYNGANGKIVMTGMNARQILNYIRDHMWPSADESSVEIFDCGPDGVDTEAIKLSISQAPARFPTIYRGANVHGLPAIKL